jgi:glycosyltransferase involved in cell wall biosynthesis
VTSSPVPVLFLARELQAGGSERQLTEIAKGLDRDRFSPHVAYFRRGIRVLELEEAGIPTLEIGIRSYRNSRSIYKALEFRKYLRNNNFQVVHTFDYPLTCFAVPIARAAAVPVVLSSHRADRKLVPQPYRAFLQITDLLVDGIVANCRAMQQQLANDGEVPQSKVHLCYNGIDPKRFHTRSEARAQGATGSKLTIGCVSVLRAEKNLEQLLRSFKVVSQDFPETQLLIVGSGPERDKLRRLAQQLCLGDRFRLKETESNVVPWLHQIDVFVLPSTSEALSNSLMEAMACGCAVIASDVGGNPELVKPGQTGLLFSTEQATALTNALYRLMTNPLLRERLANEGSAFISREFSLQRAAGRMADIYQYFLTERAGKER